MTGHRMWNRCTAGAVCLGLVMAAVVLPVVLIVVLLAMGFALTSGVLVAERLTSETEHPEKSRSTADLMRISALSTVAGLAFVATVTVLHWAGIVLFLALALGSPPVRTRLVARLGWANSPGSPRHDGGGPDPHQALLTDDLPLADLTDESLCLRWRASFVAVDNAAVSADLLSASRYRAALLDELERRDPESFRQWIDSGARAASDPQPYFSRKRP